MFNAILTLSERMTREVSIASTVCYLATPRFLDKPCLRVIHKSCLQADAYRYPPSFVPIFVLWIYFVIVAMLNMCHMGKAEEYHAKLVRSECRNQIMQHKIVSGTELPIASTPPVLPGTRQASFAEVSKSPACDWMPIGTHHLSSRFFFLLDIFCNCRHVEYVSLFCCSNPPVNC